MIFLNPLYQFLATHFENRINHFPLINLLFTSLDKTIFYFLVFIVCRLFYIFVIHRHAKKPNIGSESLLWLFVFYLMILFALTVFRNAYFPWELKFYFNRSLSGINTEPFVQTLKLAKGQTLFDLFYNVMGNIFWFIPFGFLLPYIKHNANRWWVTVLCGMLVSITIEALQFLLFSGISDVDDVLFNTLGTILGFGLYHLFHRRHGRRKTKRRK